MAEATETHRAAGVSGFDHAAFEQALDVVWVALSLPVLYDPMDLFVGHKSTMNPHRHATAGRQIKHVTHSEQAFSAHLIEDGARIDLARNLKGDPGRNIGLDQTRNYVNRGALGGQNQVDSGGACFLSQACNQLLDLLANHHHQVGQFIDHHHNLRKSTERLRGVWCQRKRVGDQGLALCRFRDLRVEAGQVTHPELTHDAVAPLHFCDTPIQCIGGLSHVGHDRREEMRNPFVNTHFEHLGIDQDESNLGRIALVEKRQQHGIDPNRLTRSGCTSHQQVRHTGQISDDGVAADIFAQGHRQRRTRIRKYLRAQNLRQSNRLASCVGQLKPHDILAGNGLDHPQ